MLDLLSSECMNVFTKEQVSALQSSLQPVFFNDLILKMNFKNAFQTFYFGRELLLVVF